MNRGTKGAIAGSVALMALAFSTIANYEGRSLRAYQDIVGVWTICYGETLGVQRGDVATAPECQDMLARQIKAYEAGLDQCLTAAVPGEVKVALVSWTYNVGIGAACRSTLVRKANAGDLRGACDQLLVWNKAGGRVVRGLTIRREAERKLCLEGLT